METKLLLEISFSVIGGLAIFLLGMKYMSEGLQNIAGNRLRKLISSVTNNRIMATGIGTFITCIIQSSSVTTVMVVGMVNSNFMTLTQAIGVIMGANIGTTITGWILVLAIGKYGLPLLGISAFVFMFSKNERARYWGMTFMGIGMVFFGLELMKNGFKPIRSLPEFVAWFSTFSATTYLGVLKCVLAGAILTMVVQSSSATLGITMGLASTGVIPFETAAALVLGENIGTTITAFLASLGTTTNAKRAAYAHIVFNVLGVLWVTALFSPYIHIVKKVLGISPDLSVLKDGVKTYPYIIAGIAAVHTGFNVTNTIIFLPFSQILSRLLERFIPNKEHKEASHLTKLDVRILETPVTAVEQSRIEILLMSEHVVKMMNMLKELTSKNLDDEKLIKKIFHRENVLDIMQKEIMEFLTNIFSEELSHSISKEARLQMRIADELESASDCIAGVLKLHLRLKKAEKEFTKKEKEDMQNLHNAVYSYLELVTLGYKQRHEDIISKANSEGDAITHKFREMRTNHIDTLSKTKADPLTSTIYMDVLNAYRRMKNQILNIAESLAGGKQ